ncbi:hypothetical protein ABPG72_002626 [Tetrahymena utriculariae]
MLIQNEYLLSKTLTIQPQAKISDLTHSNNPKNKILSQTFLVSNKDYKQKPQMLCKPQKLNPLKKSKLKNKKYIPQNTETLCWEKEFVQQNGEGGVQFRYEKKEEDKRRNQKINM